MERFPLFLVFVVTMCLLVNSNGQAANKLSTLYCLNMTLKVKDQITWTQGSPSLYHLLRQTLYTDNSGDDQNVKYSLEAVATGKLICMNSKGKLYTTSSHKIQKPKGRGRMIRWVKRNDSQVVMPPKNCLFKDYEFSSTSTYRPAIGIYSARHSNAIVGRFLAFNNGEIIGVQQRFNMLDAADVENDWIKIERLPVDNNTISEYLNKTSFFKSKRFNERVRNCIRKRSDTFTGLKGRHCVNCLKKVIPACLKKIVKQIKCVRLWRRLRAKGNLSENEIEISNPKRRVKKQRFPRTA